MTALVKNCHFIYICNQKRLYL